MILTISDSIDSFVQFLTVLIIFIFVLVITYLTTRYIAGVQKNKIRTGNMELLETLRISNNKYLQIVRAGNKYLVMAVCKDTVTMLTELDEKELIFVENDTASLSDFKGILEKARKMQKKNKNQDTDEEIGAKR